MAICNWRQEEILECFQGVALRRGVCELERLFDAGEGYLFAGSWLGDGWLKTKEQRS
jgi:hypothetical protein